MDRKIALPIGFAVVALLAVVGVLSLLSFTAAQPTEASNFDSGNLALGKITTETFNPIVSTDHGTGSVLDAGPYTVNASPTKALALATYTLKFRAPHDLANGTDEIIVTWVDDFNDITFPSLIANSAVTIRAVGDGGCGGADLPTCGVTGSNGNEGQAVSPEEVNISTVGVKPFYQTRLRIPDMDTDDNSGGNGIRKDADVTVVFRQAAGIHNPKEAGHESYEVWVRVTNDGVDLNGFADDAEGTTSVQGRSIADSDDGKRGDELTLIATGTEGREAVIFFRDSNGNGERDEAFGTAPAETDVCKTTADGDGIATCAFIITNPPMAPDTFRDVNSGTLVDGRVEMGELRIFVDDPGRFKPGQSVNIITGTSGTEKFLIDSCAADKAGLCTTSLALADGDGPADAAGIADNAVITIVGNCTLATMAGCNFINYIDSEHRSTTGEDGGALDQAAVDRQKFELDQTLTVSPDEANVGDRITVSLFDWPANSAITAMELARIPVEIPTPTPNTGGSGQVSFTFVIRGVGLDGTTRIPTGVVPLRVEAGGANEDVRLTMRGANLSLSHETVLANQDLTISGSGFTEGGGVCIIQGDITINNLKVEIDDPDDCDIFIGGVNQDGVAVTNGGTFTLTVRVHDEGSTTSINTALLSEGTMELKVLDSGKSEGTIHVTVAERTLQVNPLAARPRDPVTIIGRAFIADNADGLSTAVVVEYNCGTTTRSVTADPDVSGNFRETLRIPSNCAIPSTNTITAKIQAGGSDTGVVETVTHEIPDGLITIDPSRGASGTTVTVTGMGFRTFEAVRKIEFGGLGAIGGRTINTNADGDFTVDDVLVPGLDPGIHAVKVEVGSGNNKTTSSTSFEVLESGLVGAPTPLVDVYAMSDSILRVFRFNNSTKVWAFNDRRPEFADANSLDEVVAGGVYWLLIDQDVVLDIEGLELDLTCTGDDCWNLVVWP